MLSSPCSFDDFAFYRSFLAISDLPPKKASGLSATSNLSVPGRGKGNEKGQEDKDSVSEVEISSHHSPHTSKAGCGRVTAALVICLLWLSLGLFYMIFWLEALGCQVRRKRE